MLDISPKPEFVAEVSSNHHADLARCLQFVQVAKQVGYDTLKMQLFRLDKLFAPLAIELLPDVAMRKAWELPIAFIPEIANACRHANIGFSCTPFYLDAVAELEPYVDSLKIASYELLWTDMLRLVAQTGKPVVLATGMANMEEVQQAVNTLQRYGCCDLAILQCASGYPTPVAQANLSAIETMWLRLEFDGRFRMGWSDHTVNEGVIHRAVHKWRAEMIEFHLDLDGTGDEFHNGHCWLPEQAQKMISNVRDGFAADGDGFKLPCEAEREDVAWRSDPVDGLRPLLSERSKEKILTRNK